MRPSGSSYLRRRDSRDSRDQSNSPINFFEQNINISRIHNIIPPTLPSKQHIPVPEQAPVDTIEKPVMLNNPYKISISSLSEGTEIFDAVMCVLCKFMSVDACYTCCCDKIVCKLCIASWLEVNNFCPQCKLPSCKYEPQTKFMQKVFNSFKIKCHYEGCSEKNLTYSNFTDHEKYCSSNPNRLITCGKCKIDVPKNLMDQHDCIAELAKIYQSLEKETQQIKLNIEKENNDPLTKYIKHSLK